ncbi:hypothetical protein D3C71_73060 [compost metagenome]
MLYELKCSTGKAINFLTENTTCFLFSALCTPLFLCLQNPNAGINDLLNNLYNVYWY